MFPASDKSVDVVDTMHDYAVESGCKIVCDTANALILEDGAVIGVKCEENTYYADSVISVAAVKAIRLRAQQVTAIHLQNRQDTQSFRSNRRSCRLLPAINNARICRDLPSKMLRSE